MPFNVLRDKQKGKKKLMLENDFLLKGSVNNDYERKVQRA